MASSPPDQSPGIFKHPYARKKPRVSSNTTGFVKYNPDPVYKYLRVFSKPILRNTSTVSKYRLLDNPQFSDVVVIVGKDEQEYKLHRNIISIGSDFFAASCRPGSLFMEAIEAKIKLPEIEPTAFNIVIRWIYQGGYHLPDYIDTDDFIAVFQAADFLGIEPMKKEMLNQLIAKLPSEYWREDKTIDDPVKLYNGIAQHSAISNWVQLRRFADQVFPCWYNNDSSLVEMAQQDLGNAVRIDLYQEICAINFCTSCYPRLVNNQEGLCLMCASEIDPAIKGRAEKGVPEHDTPAGPGTAATTPGDLSSTSTL
ncbi:hypothetical protein TWF481_008809 [Arthrobotrys musiformis]|uniref:BTB domain-containing protein n=1 Tax=Arthrobotrys musiformis TaxID=47236 RepID=A0AAV9WE10_9PEZI